MSGSSTLPMAPGHETVGIVTNRPLSPTSLGAAVAEETDHNFFAVRAAHAEDTLADYMVDHDQFDRGQIN